MNTFNKSFSDLVPNEPNAAILFESLRYSDYSNAEAIADILDNSFDAEAKNIWIYLETDDSGSEKDYVIRIYDDGIGMSKDTLDEALRLGSNTKKSPGASLGKAGLGLKTAGTSIGRCIQVLTKQMTSSDVYYSSYDGDIIKKHNEWVKPLRTASKVEVDRFDLRCSTKGLNGQLVYKFLFKSQGTMIRISKIDKLTYSAIGHFKNALAKHLGEVFRKFIYADKHIFINDDEVKLLDPLLLEGDIKDELPLQPEVHKRAINLTIDGKKINFDVIVSVLPEVTDAKADHLGIGMTNQGFYLLRNNRQIARAQTLGLFTKHNSYNYIRAEIQFSGAIDDEMGLKYGKNKLEPKQAIIDSIENLIFNPIFIQKKKEHEGRSKQRKLTEMKIKHGNIERVFSKKSTLLVRPFTPGTTQEGQEKKIKEVINKYPEIKDIKPTDILRFVNDDEMSESDLLFGCEQVSELTIVKLNIKHPYMTEIFAMEEDAREKMLLLIGSLAMSKLRLPEITQNLIDDQLLREVSLNLRQLLN